MHIGTLVQKRRKVLTSLRIGAEEAALLDALAEDTGLSKASCIRLAIRDYAARRGIGLVPTRKPADAEG